MARSAFQTVIELQLRRFSPEEAKRRHIQIARAGLARFIAGQSSKPGVTLFVDGHPASSEESVKPFGVIIYRFTRMRQVVQFALEEAVRQSPVLSGEYKKAWFTMIAGAEVALSAIPQNATSVILTNDMPYSRKIMVRGARLQGVPPGIVERVRQLVLRRYGAIVTANIEYITLQGGHVLKRNGVRVHPNGRRSVRQTKGRALTYPALIIGARV